MHPPPCRLRPHALVADVSAAVAAALIVSFGSVGPTQAQSSTRFMSAGELHQRLSSTDAAAREAGRHYVLGVVDALALVRDGRSCLGAGVSASQLVDAVAGQLAARPDLHRYNAASLVREAIFVAYPCT
jgi:hypothetical protein